MTPESYQALADLSRSGTSGLIFKNEHGTFFSYRQIQAAYDSAFKRAGLPYAGTHILRHGGTRRVLELSNGDRDACAQQLGNIDRKTVDLYAVRSGMVFKNFVQKEWEKTRTSTEPGSNRQQTDSQSDALEQSSGVN